MFSDALRGAVSLASIVSVCPVHESQIGKFRIQMIRKLCNGNVNNRSKGVPVVAL